MRGHPPLLPPRLREGRWAGHPRLSPALRRLRAQRLPIAPSHPHWKNAEFGSRCSLITQGLGPAHVSRLGRCVAHPRPLPQAGGEIKSVPPRNLSDQNPKVDLAYPPAKGTAPDGDARRRGRRPAPVTGLQEDGVAAKDPDRIRSATKIPCGTSGSPSWMRGSRPPLAPKRHGQKQRRLSPERATSRVARVLTELIAGPAGGALLGWFLDRLFGTSPWLLLVMLILGVIVAFRNIYRISQQRPE